MRHTLENNFTIPFVLKDRFLKFTVVSLFLFLFGLHAFSANQDNNKPNKKGIVLIIASYNPDTKRMSEFINHFQKISDENHYGYDVLIEDLGCRGIEEADEWKKRIDKSLAKYKTENLKGIILLGQEAWISFLSQEAISHNIPFFSCFASKNGIVLPDSSLLAAKWSPEYINTQDKALEIGVSGGFMTEYDIEKNIKLIQLLYPNTKNIAFLSDNSYGGASIQAFVKKEMVEKFTDLNLILLDGRKSSVETIVHEIGNLPKNSALLIGTWRIDNNGLYFLPNTAQRLTSKNPDIPVFSLSGTGIGSIAIGGYIPDYQVDPQIIAKSIYNFHNGDSSAVKFNINPGKYVFDKVKLKEYGINDYHLPSNSTFVSDLEQKLQTYRIYAIVAIVIASLLTLFIIVLFRLYFNIKSLKNSLKKSNKELLVAKNKAEESERLKTSFLANMSHEIRTPLNAIVGFSNLLLEEGYNIKEKKQFSSIISKNSDLLLTLINDILDISRMETNKMQYKFMDEDINILCKGVLSSLEHTKNPNVNYVFAPCCDNPFVLNTDRQRLSQILINFITNANKFTESGSITLGYDIFPEKNEVVFSVTDTGIGIPPEKQNQIFNRFEKLDEFKQGTGLGLTICKQIANAFGGTVWIDSNYTNGARFMFSHPIKRN